MKRIYAFLAALAISTSGTAGSPNVMDEASDATFDGLKSLVGKWRPSNSATSALRIQFSLTAGGTVLVEEWSRKSEPHSMTVYHRDGRRLIATHYCPQGNQPRLQQIASNSAKLVGFQFLDVTDLDPVKEAHLTKLSFDVSDKALLIRRETYTQGGVDEASELRLVRDE